MVEWNGILTGCLAEEYNASQTGMSTARQEAQDG